MKLSDVVAVSLMLVMVIAGLTFLPGKENETVRTVYKDRIILDSIHMIHFADSVRKASVEQTAFLADSIAKSRTKWLLKKRLIDTVFINDTVNDTVSIQVNTLKTLIISDSACRVERDSLQLEIEHAKHIAKHEVGKRIFWTAGAGFLAGVLTCATILGIAR